MRLPRPHRRRQMPALLLALAVVGVGTGSVAHAQSGAVYARYIKASNIDADDFFGASIAISGNTLVVGASGEDSNATGVNGNQADNSATDSGAAYVYRLTTNADGSSSWVQRAYLKASNAEAGDYFGSSVAIDGDRIVVGAPYEDSAAFQVNGNQASNASPAAGAAYVFVRTYLLGNEYWTQQAYLKASNSDTLDGFGGSVTVAGDLVVVGSPFEDGGIGGVNPPQGDESASNAGAAYVYRYTGSFWLQDAMLRPLDPEAGGQFGTSMAASGSRVVIGAPEQDALNGTFDVGAAYVFSRSGAGVWSQTTRLQMPAAATGSYFGNNVAMDASTIVVGAPSASSGVGITGGATYVYQEATIPFSVWQLNATLVASNSQQGDRFGSKVAIAGDQILVGAPFEDSSAAGVGGNQADNSFPDAGAAYLYTRSGSVWSQAAYLKASNPGLGDFYGASVALSTTHRAVGAPREDGSSVFAPTNGAPDAGAVYTYRPLIDCDNDGLDDPAELAQGGNDCNANGVLDSCDVLQGASDCNGNFVPDSCEGDVNLDGTWDACQVGGVTFCAGDGTGTACPCGNSGVLGSGCGNSVNAQGARLVASGLPSVLHDSLVLAGSGMTPSSSVLYFQGTTQGAGAVFGDGLRCATGVIIRLGTTTNANGASSWPVSGAQSISVRGAIPAGGGVVRTYQAWYRDANATYCTDTARFNLTNGVRVQWVL